MSDKKWSELMAEYSEELAALSNSDTEFLNTDTALPAWVKYLMAMQLDAVFNHPTGARSYGKRANEKGATADQIVEAIKILRMFGGRPAMVTGVEGLRDLKR